MPPVENVLPYQHPVETTTAKLTHGEIERKLKLCFSVNDSCQINHVALMNFIFDWKLSALRALTKNIWKGRISKLM